MTNTDCPCQSHYTDDHVDSCQFADVYGGETGIRGRDDRRERFARDHMIWRTFR